MTIHEQMMFREFVKSIQSIQTLNLYIEKISNSDDLDLTKFARALEVGVYLETIDEDSIKAFQDSLKYLPLACTDGNADKLIEFLENTEEIQLSQDVKDFIKTNYQDITPENIFQEEKALQNNYIEELQLKTGVTKEQAVQYEALNRNGNNTKAMQSVYNTVASALCQHPEIKKLGLENVEKLDEHAKQVITKVVEDIKSGKDESGLFFPYIDEGDPQDHYSWSMVEDVLEWWRNGTVQPVDIKKFTSDDIKKELMEGVNIQFHEDDQIVFVKKSEEELQKAAEREIAISEERARHFTVNKKYISNEVAFSADEDDITFYKECFEKVPGLSEKLFGTKENPVKLSTLDIEQYNQRILDAFFMVNKSAPNNMSYDDYDIGSIRNLFKYAAAKQDKMLAENDEYKIDDAKINASKAENQKYIDELDQIVKQSDLFKPHLADPVPTYEQTEDSYLKTYEKNKKQYIDKLNNSFDYLSNDKKNELIQEAERLSKGHPYINSTDIMKYLIYQESEILRSYNACIDSKDLVNVRERYLAPFTLESIGRAVGVKAMAPKLDKQEEPKKEEPQVIEELKQEIKEDVQEILQPEIKEEVKIEEPKKEEPQFTEDIEFEEPQIIEEQPVQNKGEWLPDEQTLGIAYREMTRHIDVLSSALGCRPEGYTMPEGLSENRKAAELLSLLQNDSMRLSKLKGEDRDVMMATIDSVLDSWKKGELDNKVAVPTPVDRHRDYVTAEALYDHIAKQQDLNEKHYMKTLAGVEEIREASMEYMIFRKLQTEGVIDNILGYGIRDDLESYKYLADPQNNYLTSKEKQNNLKNKISQINDAFMEELFKQNSISKEELDYYKANHESFTPEAADMFFTQEYDQLLTSYAVQFHGSKEIESDPNLLSIDSSLAYNLIQKANTLPEKENVIRQDLREEIKPEVKQVVEELKVEEPKQKENKEAVKSNGLFSKKLDYTNEYIASKFKQNTIKNNQNIVLNNINDGGIPLEVQMTNDVNYLNSWYEQNKDTLSKEADAFFQSHYQASCYFELLSQNKLLNKKTPDDMDIGFYDGVNEFEKGEYSILNIGVGKQRNQTSANGCWSCAFENLLRSRGVEIPQEMIRSFRSNRNINTLDVDGYKTDAQEMDQKGFSGKRNVAIEFMTDASSNVMSRADLMLRVLPNTAMRSKEFRFPTEPEMYNAGAQNDLDEKLIGNMMLETVRDAIGLKKSPVAVVFGGHYRTITSVNVEKRTIKWVDSMDKDPNAEREIKIDDLVAHIRTARSEASIEFSWMEDLVPDEKGNLGISGFDDLKYKGKGLYKNDKSLSNAKSNHIYVKDGYFDSNPTIIDNKIMIADHVCLPKQLINLTAYKKQTPPEIADSGKNHTYSDDPYPLPTNARHLDQPVSSAPDKVEELKTEDVTKKYKVYNDPNAQKLIDAYRIIENWDEKDKYFTYDLSTKKELNTHLDKDVELQKSLLAAINKTNQLAAENSENPVVFKNNPEDLETLAYKIKGAQKDHYKYLARVNNKITAKKDSYKIPVKPEPKLSELKFNKEAIIPKINNAEPVKQTQIKTDPEADDDFHLFHDDEPVNNVQKEPVIQESDAVTELNKYFEGLVYEKIIRNNLDMYQIAFGLQYEPGDMNEFREAVKNISNDLLIDDETRRNALRKHYKDWFKQAENLEEIQKLCTDDELTVLPYLDVEGFLDKMSEMQLDNLSRYNAALDKKVQQNVSLADKKIAGSDNVKKEVKEEIKKEEIKKEEPKIIPKQQEVPKQKEPQINPKLMNDVMQSANALAIHQKLVNAMLKEQYAQPVQNQFKQQVPQNMPKPAVRRNPNPVSRIAKEQIAPYTDEIVRLSDRITTSHSSKQNNSMTYKALKFTITDCKSTIKGETGIKTVNELEDVLKNLNESADQYMNDHANDKMGFFRTCGKGRQERIKTCARIKTMKELFDQGIPYDSPAGKKRMLACKLVCAEYLEHGFNGFQALCKKDAIKKAIDNKMKDHNFNMIANGVCQNNAEYDKLVKTSGSKFLKSYRNAEASIEKAKGMNMDQAKDLYQMYQTFRF